jgi:hypothetical protein
MRKIAPIVVQILALHVLATASQSNLVQFSFDAAVSTGSLVTRELYGMNVARWDHGLFPSTTSQMLLTCDRDAILLLKQLNPGLLKYPGGNDADSYIWNASENPALDMDSEEFLSLARTCNAPGFFTVNFTAGPELAAQWVQHMNDLAGHSGSIPYWEVGDEVWGPWAKSHVPGDEYARRFRQFSKAMKSVDPSIKLAANLSLSNAGSSWTREAIGSLGNSFDVITMTYFAQDPPNENDAKLLSSAERYRSLFRNLEKAVSSAYPERKRPEYCLVGFNSTSSRPGPQTLEMVNGVFMAQMYGSMAETGTDMSCWWAFHNAYPPRAGDYGVLSSDGRNTPHYPYWVMKLLSNSFTGRFLCAQRQNGLEFYALKRQDNSVACLLINTTTETRSAMLTWTGMDRLKGPLQPEIRNGVTSATVRGAIRTAGAVGNNTEIPQGNRSRQAWLPALEPYSVSIVELRDAGAESEPRNIAGELAVSASSFNRSFNYRANNLNDGDPDTMWASEDWLQDKGRDQQWIQLIPRYTQIFDWDRMEIEWGSSYANKFAVRAFDRDSSETLFETDKGKPGKTVIPLAKLNELKSWKGIGIQLIEGQHAISSYEIREIKVFARPKANVSSN